MSYSYIYNESVILFLYIRLVSVFQSGFSSFIIANYYVGDVLASFVVFIFSSVIRFAFLSFLTINDSFIFSALSTLISVCRILLEDLLVFLSEVSESLTNAGFLVLSCFYMFVDVASHVVSGTLDNVGRTVQCLTNSVSLLYAGLTAGLSKCGELFSLVGSSLVLLVDLLPRTLYLLYLATGQLLSKSVQSCRLWLTGLYHSLSSTSPEMLLGLATCIITSCLAAHFILRTVRERNITWAIVLGTALWLFCTAYIFIFESIVRCLRVMVRLTEMTFSNLRVPMFAHAGDSEDEEEDREPLVAAVEDSDEEENERRETKRRNYLLLRERANNRRGSGELEDDLMTEIERERENKLCCICQDMEVGFFYVTLISTIITVV